MGLSQISSIASEQTLVNKHESTLFDDEKLTCSGETRPTSSDGKKLASANEEKPTSLDGEDATSSEREKPAYPDREKSPSFKEEKPMSSGPKMSSASNHVITDVDFPTTEEDELEWKLGRQELLVMISLMLVSLIAALDATILTIAKALKGNANDTFWAGTSYLLANTVFQPFIATLSDVFGRRELLIVSTVLFTAGTIIGCASQTFIQLLAGRSFQGVGGGGIIALTNVIFADIVPLRQRPRYWSLIQLTWAFGTMAGPLVGGLFAQHVSWRWVFYINFPFCALAMIIIPFVFRLKTRRRVSGESVLRVDWLGGMLFCGSFTSFLIGLTWGGVQFPWGDFRTVLPLLVGVVGIATTMAWEYWGAREPFLRLALFSTRSQTVIYFCAVMQGLLLFCMIYYVPLFLQAVKSLSPTLTGVGALGISVGTFTSSVIVGLVMTRTGHFRWAIWSGWCITTLGNGLLILLDVPTSTMEWVIFFLVLGFGHGFLLSALGLSAQAATKDANMAHAAAMYSFTRTLGMSFGVAIGGTIFQNQLPHSLKATGLSPDIAKDAERFVITLNNMSVSPEYRHSMMEAYAQALRLIFKVLTGISAIGGLASILIRSHSMDKTLHSEHVFNREEAVVFPLPIKDEMA